MMTPLILTKEQREAIYGQLRARAFGACDDYREQADGTCRCSWAEDHHIARAAADFLDAQEAQIAQLTAERDDAIRKRVTKRERREWEDVQGDATVLRGFIREFGCTPTMMASSRDHWERRATAAEAERDAQKAEAARLRTALEGAIATRDASVAAVGYALDSVDGEFWTGDIQRLIKMVAALASASGKGTAA